MGTNRRRHGRQVLGRSAAAAPNDADTRVDGQCRIPRHQLGRPRIRDGRALELGDSAVAFAHHRRRIGIHLEHRNQDVARADTIVGADRERWDGKTVELRTQHFRREPHHRSSRGVETHRAHVRHADADRRLGGRPHLLRCRHRLDPRDVRAASLQTLDLFGEGVDRLVVGECSERLEQLTRRPHAAGHDDRSRRGVRDAACQPRGTRREFADSILGIVQLQSMTIAPERVGEDDVRAGIHEGLMQPDHLVGLVGDPEFGRLSGFEADLEIVRARRAVGEQWSTGVEKLLEGRSHGANASPSRFRRSPLRSAVAKMPRG